MPGTIAIPSHGGQHPSCTDPDRISAASGGASDSEPKQNPVLAWLQAVNSNPRAQVITREPEQGWVSEKRAWPLPCIANAVYSSSQIVGLRPEGRIRWTVADIDRKPHRVSRYWHPYGQSTQLRALEREAIAAGCSCTMLRSSSSGGLYALIQLPAALRAWEAHWVGAELVARAGMTLESGQCELFPSRIDYCSSPDPSTWAQSHGIRLPGQLGGALLIGDRTAADTDLVYEELLQALDDTQLLPAWDELLEAATARRLAVRRNREVVTPQHCLRRASKRSHGVRWTGSGQSHDNMARITSWARAAHPEARTVDELAPIIREAALNAPGFAEHASAASRDDVLGGWPERWARSSLRRDRAPGTPAPKGSDPHHNRRLFLQSRAALTRLWKEVKNAAELSQRTVAEKAGLNRKCLRRHWDYWLQLLGGPHPSLTGGAVPSSEFQSLQSVPSVAAAEPVTYGVLVSRRPGPSLVPTFSSRTRPKDSPKRTTSIDPPLSPFKSDAVPIDPWRARQRAELMAWIGAA
jgi:hypothetical protein